jgi:hypothetical protein
LAVVIPFFLLRKLRLSEQKMMLSSVAFCLVLAVVLFAVFNTPNDRQAQDLVRPYYIPTYLFPTLWAGYGLVLLGTLMTRVVENLKSRLLQ